MKINLFTKKMATAFAITALLFTSCTTNANDDSEEETTQEDTEETTDDSNSIAIRYTPITGNGSSQTQSLSLTTIDIDQQDCADELLDSNGDISMTALQAKLDVFDNEDNLAPYFIAEATGDSSSQVWTVTYGSAAGSSLCGTTLSGTSYGDTNGAFSNGFDAINAAMAALPSSRSAKLKIRVDSDLYSGEPETATNSASSDFSGLYSISVKSKSILDFNGHTLYANNETVSEIVPLSAKKKSYISIRNLNMKGHARYALWFVGCDNVVFDNISMDMDSDSGLGLRVAESSKTWSTNIYIDNIYARGMGDNAVETMKVDGLYVGTVTATDCNDCGLLLNTTTNAVVGVVNGTRCSPRSSSGVYAALRTANYVGPNVHIHQINASECGRGYFSVSANSGITIDELNSTNSYAQAILVQDTENLHIKKATLTAGSHNSSKAVEFASGSAGGSLNIMNNTFENVTITGYKYGFYDHATGVSDHDNFINCTFSGVTTPYTLYGDYNITATSLPTSTDSVTIDTSATEIAEGAYKNNTSITSITIPATVTTIGKDAFYGCTNLTSVTFASGSTLTTIEDGAFANTAIESISFPSSVTTFGSNILGTSCSSVTVQSTSISSMGVEAFFSLNDSSTITFQDSSLYSGNTYSTGSYGDWGAYWYGHTRSTVN